jgi:diguanylate cyclase (GGDEF)-like protein
MSVADHRIQSNLAEEVNQRLISIMAVVGLLGSALIALTSGALALLQANRTIIRQTDQIAATVSTLLQSEANAEQQQNMLQIYRAQPLSNQSDTIISVLVFDSAGKVRLSSRASLLGRSVAQVLQSPELDATLDPAVLRCFLDPQLGCPDSNRSFYFPWQSTQTELRPLRLFSFDAVPKENRYLVAVTFGSESTNLLVIQQVLLVLSFNMLILGGLLTALTVTLKKNLLPGLQRVAETDALTNLANRRTFMDISQKMLQRGLDEGLSHVLCMVDIDCFKHINDTYGHVCGDEVLKHVAQELRAALRERDLVARLGGEEFGLLLQSSSAMAEVILERVRKGVEASATTWDGEPIDVTISLGVAGTEELGQSLDYLYAAADAALYRAKEEGRNRVRWASAPRLNPLPERREINIVQPSVGPPTTQPSSTPNR